MRASCVVAAFALLMFLPLSLSHAQSNPGFDLSAYEAFLRAHNDISPAELRSMHSAGTFEAKALTAGSMPLRLDSIDRKYSLLPGERLLLDAHGFVVSERLWAWSYGAGLDQIWRQDLPVYISSDAVLHALHMSYDAILSRSEERYMIPKLSAMLQGMHRSFDELEVRYAADSSMHQCLMDLDLYLAVARSLLDGECMPVSAMNVQGMETILQSIRSEQPGKLGPLFGDSLRIVDYSQFTVRGHYTATPALSRYFQAMMWIGRTEFYLSPPDNNWDEDSRRAIRRQAADALLFAEASTIAAADSGFQEIDRLLGFFVGEQDNVALPQLAELRSELGLQSAAGVLDSLTYDAFHDALMAHAWAHQRIVSQIIKGHTFEPGQVQPASAFLPLGQRFLIDSYVFSKVVFDNIEFNGAKVWRGLPSPLDALFALGNDAAGQLLAADLDQYQYAENLAALRYLIDTYEPTYWNSNFFNGWLNAIRALNPPEDRSALPPFMRTAAWWQEKMNTQLASWAELRHDNILYGKQSYTPGTTCSYPCGYVEPVPLMFERLDTLLSGAAIFFETVPAELRDAQSYFIRAAERCSTLAVIACKELSHVPLSAGENGFLANTYYWEGQICGDSPLGWYPGLFYVRDAERKSDEVVADVHTCPTDASGDPVGWVLHVGTGPVNMAIVIADIPDVGPSAYIGPVSSYYQQVTSNFKRLTDEEWSLNYESPTGARPSWVNAYLADKTGNIRPPGEMLMTGIAEPPGGGTLPSEIMIAQNYPNPFNPSTTITYGLPGAAHVNLTIFDNLGRQVCELVGQNQESGVHSALWNGTTSSGAQAASGAYFARLLVRSIRGDNIFTKTMSMMLVR